MPSVVLVKLSVGDFSLMWIASGLPTIHSEPIVAADRWFVIQPCGGQGPDRGLAIVSSTSAPCKVRANYLASSISAAQMFPFISPAVNMTPWRVIDISRYGFSTFFNDSRLL